MLTLGLILFITSIILNFPFPHESPFGETVASVLNIPIRSVDGFHYVGIASFILFIVSLYFVTKSAEKYHGRIILFSIIIVLIAPPILASSFQKTLATGIYAVSYERDSSSCHFKMINETTLHGESELPFENYSKEDVQFTLEFYNEDFLEDDIRMVSLMNNNSPYEVNLKGNERKTVRIESKIDVSNIEDHVENGSSSYINIIIKSGEKIRNL